LRLGILPIDEGEVTLIDATHGFIIFRASAAIQKVDDAAKVQFTMGDVLPETGC
jgi:hypothetical protein